MTMKLLTVCITLSLSRAVPLNCTLPLHSGLCGYERQMCSSFLGADFLRCGIFCPQCDANGNFLPKQCWGLTGYCWHVDISTGCEIPNTRTPPGTEPNFGSKGQCPHGWSSFGRKCFIFIDTPKKWIDSESGFWIWSDGSEFSYKNWYDDDAKKNDKKKHCLGINYEYDIKWFYASCTKSLPFICAKRI